MALRNIARVAFALLGALSLVFAQNPAPATAQPNVPAPVVTGPAPVPVPAPAPPGSCVGFCGGQSNGDCFCDSQCTGLGDCCADFDDVCDIVPAPSTSGSTTVSTTVPVPSTSGSTAAPAPVPSTSGPAPTPSTSGPAPAPSTSGPAPAPSTSGPSPAPSTSGPAPVPSTSGPAPAPAPVPSSGPSVPSPSVTPRTALCGDHFVSSTVGAPRFDIDGSSGGKVVYELQTTGVSFLTVSTCNNQTDYDTFLWMYQDEGLTALLASNDDFCGLLSEITLPVNGTESVFVVVGGFSSNEGTFEITFQCSDSTAAPAPSPFFTNETTMFPQTSTPPPAPAPFFTNETTTFPQTSTPPPAPAPFFTNETTFPFPPTATGFPITSAPTPAIDDCSCSAELESLKTEIISTVTEQIVSQISALISSSQSSVVAVIQTETHAIINSRIDGLRAQLDALQLAAGNSTN